MGVGMHDNCIGGRVNLYVHNNGDGSQNVHSATHGSKMWLFAHVIMNGPLSDISFNQGNTVQQVLNAQTTPMECFL